MACNGMCGRGCALLAVSDALEYAVSIQTRGYWTGRYGYVSNMDPLFQLHGYVRMGVCAKTATLPLEYVPNLEPLLRQLEVNLQMHVSHAIMSALAQTAQTPSVLPFQPRSRDSPR